MSRHHERTIRRAQETVASVDQRAERTEPRTRAEVESFVKGFGMSAAATRRVVDEWMADQQRARDAGWAATRRVVDEWMADQQRARDAGWESHADSVWWDEG